MNQDVQFRQSIIRQNDDMLLDKDNNWRNLQGITRDENGHLHSSHISTKKTWHQVATKLIAQSASPIISAPVTPNPLTTVQSPTEINGDSHNTTTTTIPMTDLLITNIDDTHQETITDTQHHDATKINNNNNRNNIINTTHQKQYLISRFFHTKHTTNRAISENRNTIGNTIQ
jgi:hypothetical protein